MYLIYSTLIILATTVSASTVVAQTTYQLSMLPNYSSEEINRRIRPLAKYLSQKTGSNIEAVITHDFTHYEKQLKNGSIDIGYENPFIYTLVAESHEVIAMALMGKDQEKFRGIIIVRKDTGLQGIEDLRGKKISIVGYTSAGGYLSQKLSLMKAGVNIAKECNIVEAVGNKQENVILSVYTGDVAAGFIRESALNKADNFIAPNQLMVIGTCAWLPNWALSVKKTLPKKLKKLIRIALLDLKPGHRVIKALQIERFRPAKDSEYDTIRQASRKE